MKTLEVIKFPLAALYMLLELHAIPILRAEACNIQYMPHQVSALAIMSAVIVAHISFCI